MKIHCTHCGQHLELGDDYVGYTISCPTCQGQLLVSAKGGSSPPRNRYHVWLITGLVAVVGIVSTLLIARPFWGKKLPAPKQTNVQTVTPASDVMPRANTSVASPEAEVDSKLVFKADATGELSFDTGVVKGSLTKDGKGEGLKAITIIDGAVAVDQNHGLLCPYRFLTPERRYGFGSWEWPRTGKILQNGAAQLLWESTPDRPFAFSTVYHWKSPDTLDFTVFFAPQTNLNKFELFLGSYFDKFTKGEAFMKDAADNAPGLLEASDDKGEIRLFPASQEVLATINDGRWKYPPYPLNMAIQAPLAAPLGIRSQPKSGATVVFMSPPEDCFALSMWTKGWSQCGFYLSLFGKDMQEGHTQVAHVRLVFGKSISDSQAVERYKEYLKEVGTQKEEPIFSNAEKDAMAQALSARPAPLPAGSGDAHTVLALPDWISPEIPKASSDGWINVFDGRKLWACSPTSGDLEAHKIALENGMLNLRNYMLPLNLRGENLTIRALLRLVNGTDARLGLRVQGPQKYMFWFGKGGFNMGLFNGRWNFFGGAPTEIGLDQFFEMEFQAQGKHLTGLADGKVVKEADDPTLTTGVPAIGNLGGTVAIKRIDVKVEDGAGGGQSIVREGGKPSEKSTPQVSKMPRPDWMRLDMPKPDQDGWIPLFDGHQLYVPLEPDFAAQRTSLQDGMLTLRGALHFNLKAENVILRAQLKQVSSNTGFSLRRVVGSGHFVSLESASILGSQFTIRRDASPRKELAQGSATLPADSFFQAEFKTEGTHLSLTANGKVICEGDDDKPSQAGTIGVLAGGTSIFKRIEVKILDGQSPAH